MEVNQIPEIGKISPIIFNELIFPRLGAESEKEQLEIVCDTMNGECERLRISVICGHTARYENCHYPMVGGATVISIGEKDEYVIPRLARAGDRIIITKGPAIKATGIFAAMFPRLIERELWPDFSQRAQQIFYKMSVVEDAMNAVGVVVREDGVTAMHDATECGVWGGLYELSQAANLGIRIERESIVLEDCVKEICNLFGIDPYASISEGTLIIACRENKAQEVIAALSQKVISSSIVGQLINPKHGMILVEAGKEKKLEHPLVDPFWGAFYRALERYASNGATK